MRPIVMLILDGAADVPGCESYSVSPLAAAKTPGLDKLARNGHAGLLFPIGEGVEPETHSGMLNLFGYPLMPSEAPRGPIEALGCGLKVETGDLVLRVNFGTRDETTGLIADRRVCRSLSLDDAMTLCRDLVEHLRITISGYEVDMRVVREYRGCAVIHSKTIRLSQAISNTDPGYPTEGQQQHCDGGYEPIACRALNGTKSARQTADLVNDFVSRSEEFLREHPINRTRRAAGGPLANAILTRGPGCSLPNVDPISARFGVPFTLLADLPIESGVGLLVGCKVHNYLPGEDLEKTYRSLAEEIMRLALPDTVTVVHVKGPDEYGHDGDFHGKVRSIEEIDQWLIEPLSHDLLGRSIIIVTSDHATPCFFLTHTADPVPFVVAGNRVPHNGATRLTEQACAKLQSTVRRGTQLLSFAVQLAKL
jgi:2,3-bisphosphoglycerate-independent phosphoglycerate mutase